MAYYLQPVSDSGKQTKLAQVVTSVDVYAWAQLRHELLPPIGPIGLPIISHIMPSRLTYIQRERVARNNIMRPHLALPADACRVHLPLL
jgi:hypothetical protein